MSELRVRLGLVWAKDMSGVDRTWVIFAGDT